MQLADESRPLYERLGHALPDRNGEGWTLPVPATYVIAPSGEIVLAFVDTDYRRRLEPADAVAAAGRRDLGPPPRLIAANHSGSQQSFRSWPYARTL